MKIDKEKFLFMYEETEFKRLKDSAQSDLVNLLGYIEADDKITDERWAAYMLATTFHECAGTWQPIAEYGKGKGKEYGKPDSRTGKTYYGRGFVQLTWDDNYLTMGKLLDIDLLNNPDLAMKPDIAYSIMSWGMRKGMFTGVGLPKYINAEKCDYIGARKIINGTDKAQLIAGYAVKFERILKECINGTATA
jgi:putative chitinase